MRHATIILAALSTGCAHIPRDLEAWATEKALRVGECAAQELITRGDAARCIGPAYLRDLGTEACEQAHALLEELPVEERSQ